MEFLIGALIVLVLIDLLMTFGVVRRLREHGERIRGLQASQMPGITLQPGTPVPDFSSVSVSADDLRTTTTKVVAFFSEDCKACTDDIPMFRDRLRSMNASDLSVFVAVMTQSEDNTHAVELASELGDLVTVITEPMNGPVQDAFEVSLYPTYFMIDHDGVISAVTHRAADLPMMAPAH